MREDEEHPGVDQVRYDDVDSVRIEDGALRILGTRPWGIFPRRRTIAYHPATDQWQSVFLSRSGTCLVTLLRRS